MISGKTGSERNQGNCRMYSCSNKGKQVVKECHCRKVPVEHIMYLVMRKSDYFYSQIGHFVLKLG